MDREERKIFQLIPKRLNLFKNSPKGDPKMYNTIHNLQ